MKDEVFALCVSVIFIELGLCWAFAMFADYTGDSIGKMENDPDRIHGTHPRKHLSSNIYYYMFQDVHLTTVVGFGFLVTFLRRYGNSSAALNLLLAAITLQWATLCQGFFHMRNGKIHISIANLLNADFASAAAFISFGAVVDSATPLQLIAMTFCEIILFATNEYIGLEVFQISDVGASMLVHVFGAYFGLMVSFVLQRNGSKPENKGSVGYSTDLFAAIGTIFLWLFWPSLNASLAEGDAQHRAIINTYYSLTASTVLTFAISSCLSKKQRFNTALIHNSVLAGGVAIGTAADMMIHPFGAIVVGSAAGIVSVLGTVYLTPVISRKFGIRDLFGIHNLHGLPGLIAACVGAIAAAVATEKGYDYTLYRQFPARAPLDGSRDYWSIWSQVGRVIIKPGLGRSALMQGAYQMASLGSTLAFAIVGGLVTGLILRLPIFGQAGGNRFANDDF